MTQICTFFVHTAPGPTKLVLVLDIHVESHNLPMFIGYFNCTICNLWDLNIVDIFDKLFILRIEYEYTETNCEEGARDVNNISVSVITTYVFPPEKNM